VLFFCKVYGDWSLHIEPLSQTLLHYGTSTKIRAFSALLLSSLDQRLRRRRFTASSILIPPPFCILFVVGWPWCFSLSYSLFVGDIQEAPTVIIKLLFFFYLFPPNPHPPDTSHSSPLQRCSLGERHPIPYSVFPPTRASCLQSLLGFLPSSRFRHPSSIDPEEILLLVPWSSR